jgi:colicin import membrane protein
MNTDLTRPRNGWEFTQAHQALLSKMSKESGLESRLDPPEDHTGEKAGLTVSVLAHLALLAFFVIGLNWNTEEPAAFEAVLWSELPANEPVVVQQPKPEPEPVPEPPKPEPVVENPPPPKPVEPPKAEIELPKPEPKKPEPKPEPKKPEPKPEPKKPEPKKPEPKPEPKKPEPKPQPKIDPELAKKLRQEELARIMGGAPNTGSSPASTSDNSRYKARISQHVKSRIVFPNADSVDGNPAAEFVVKQLPTGEIVSITLKKSSGLPAWDSAVERALQRSSPLPKAEEGEFQPLIELSYRPKDV